MPGGAPLKKTSKRPCKYGPRDSEGKCPKKPPTPRKSSSSQAASKSSKRPCKYGPRTPEGRCPPKPKAPKKVKQLQSVEGAAKQATQVLRSKEATTSQKKEAVKVLGTAVAVDVTKKVAADAQRKAKQALKKPETRKAIAKVAKEYGIPVAKAAGVATGVGVTLAVGGAALSANRAREAKKYADRELAKTKKKLGKALTPEMEKTLHKQYEDHAKKQPVYTPTIK